MICYSLFWHIIFETDFVSTFSSSIHYPIFYILHKIYKKRKNCYRFTTQPYFWLDNISLFLFCKYLNVTSKEAFQYTALGPALCRDCSRSLHVYKQVVEYKIRRGGTDVNNGVVSTNTHWLKKGKLSATYDVDWAKNCSRNYTKTVLR